MAATIDNLIKDAAKSLGSDAPDKVKNSAKEVVEKILLDGASPKEAMGFNDEMLEYLYSIAYTEFKNGKYSKALTTFTYLRDLDPLIYRYTFAIAACHHYMKDYEKAIGEYSLCALLDEKDPKCYYYMAECLIEEKDAKLAMTALQDAVLRSKDKPEFVNIYEISSLTLEKLSLENKLNTEEK